MITEAEKSRAQAMGFGVIYAPLARLIELVGDGFPDKGPSDLDLLFIEALTEIIDKVAAFKDSTTQLHNSRPQGAADV